MARIRIRDHDIAADPLAPGQAHAHRTPVPDHDFIDLGPLPDHPALPLNHPDHGAGDGIDATDGIVHAKRRL